MKWITRDKVKADRVACPWLKEIYRSRRGIRFPATTRRTGRKSTQTSTAFRTANSAIVARTFPTRFSKSITLPIPR